MISESEERYFKALRDRYARVCELYPTNKAGSEGDNAIQFCRSSMLSHISYVLAARGIPCEIVDPESGMTSGVIVINHLGEQASARLVNRFVFFQSLQTTIDEVLTALADSIDESYPLPWPVAKEQP